MRLKESKVVNRRSKVDNRRNKVDNRRSKQRPTLTVSVDWRGLDMQRTIIIHFILRYVYN